VKRALAVLALALVLTAALFTPFCGLVHRCGCRLTEARCNIANPTGPHCPWCQHRVLGAAVFAGVVLAEGGVAWATRRKSLAAQSAATLATFPVVGLVFSALAWLPTDYPHFLVLDARSALHLPAGPISCHGEGKACCVSGE
jgi:hypothetical protein